MAKPKVPAADENRAASVTAIRKGKKSGTKRPVKKAPAGTATPKSKSPKTSRPTPAATDRTQSKSPVKKSPTASTPRKTPPRDKPASGQRASTEAVKKKTPKDRKDTQPDPSTKSIADSIAAADPKQPGPEREEQKPTKESSPSDVAAQKKPEDQAIQDRTTTPTPSPESSSAVAVETKPQTEIEDTQSKADLRWSNAETSTPASSTADSSSFEQPSAASSNGSSVASEPLPDPSNSINAAPPLSLPEMPVAPPDEPPTAPSEPVESTANESAAESSDQWFVQTYVGDQFGPLTKAELDDWVTQGRLTGDCHVFQEGWTEWREGRAVYPELEFVAADDEVELAQAEGDKVDRTVSSSEPNWYTVRTGLTMISRSTVVGIVALLLLTVGFFVDRVPLSQLYFDTMHDREIDPDHGGGLVSMVLVSWGTIGIFMALVGILTGAIACLAVPRKTNLHPYAVGAMSAVSIAVFTAVLMFTAAFLTLGPIKESINAGSVLKTLLTATPWALLLTCQAAMAAIVVFACMLAEFLEQPKIARQMRWFAGLQGGLLFWVLLDAAIIPDDSDGLFTFSLFLFLAAVTASLSWLTYIARSVSDAIRPS